LICVNRAPAELIKINAALGHSAERQAAHKARGCAAFASGGPDFCGQQAEVSLALV